MFTQSITTRKTKDHPHSSLCSYRVINEQRNRSPKPRYTRAEREVRKSGTKQRLVDLATAAGEHEQADKYQRCHGKALVIACKNQHIAKIIPDFSCENRLCPYCSRKRSSRLLHKYLPAVVAFPAVSHTQPVHLVLTQAHRKETLREAVKRLTGHFKALRRRSIWNEHFKGGMFAVEFTIGRDGLYHAHLHILAFRTRFFNVQLLKDAWLAITGDSTNLRLDRITGDHRAGVREVLKYAVKPASIADFTVQHFRDFMAMENQNMFGTFGDFRKFAREYKPDPETLSTLFPHTETQTGEPCSMCGEALYAEWAKESELAAILQRCDASQSIE